MSLQTQTAQTNFVLRSSGGFTINEHVIQTLEKHSFSFARIHEQCLWFGACVCGVVWWSEASQRWWLHPLLAFVQAGRQVDRPDGLNVAFPSQLHTVAQPHTDTHEHTKRRIPARTISLRSHPAALSGWRTPPMERRVARSRLSRVWPPADIEWFGVFLTPLFAACSLSTSNRSRIVLGLLPPPHVFASRSLTLISGPHTMVCNMAEHTMLSLRRSPALRCLLLHTRSMPFGGTFCKGNRNRCPVPFTHSLALEQNNTSPTKSRAVTHL